MALNIFGCHVKTVTSNLQTLYAKRAPTYTHLIPSFTQEVLRIIKQQWGWFSKTTISIGLTVEYWMDVSRSWYLYRSQWLTSWSKSVSKSRCSPVMPLLAASSTWPRVCWMAGWVLPPSFYRHWELYECAMRVVVMEGGHHLFCALSTFIIYIRRFLQWCIDHKYLPDWIHQSHGTWFMGSIINVNLVHGPDRTWVPHKSRTDHLFLSEAKWMYS